MNFFDFPLNSSRHEKYFLPVLSKLFEASTSFFRLVEGGFDKILDFTPEKSQKI